MTKIKIKTSICFDSSAHGLVCNKKYAEKIALKNHTKLQVRKGKTTRWEKSQGDIHEHAHMQINRQQKRQDNVANAPRLHCLHSHKHARHTHLLGSSVVAFNSRTFFCLTEPTKKQRLSSSPSILNGESCSSLFANAFPEFSAVAQRIALEVQQQLKKWPPWLDFQILWIGSCLNFGCCWLVGLSSSAEEPKFRFLGC